ncbi:unnamed protein product, partial [Rotaria sordida]
NLDGLRHYCACLTFHQTLLPTTIAPTNNLFNKKNGCSNEADNTAFLLPRTQMYAPKCLFLTSKLDCFEAFRNCLGLVYTMYIEPLSDIRIETLVGNILDSVNVLPPGGHALHFSIGADDRQVIQPPASPTVPCTGLSVCNLFKESEIDHVVTIFYAALSDMKILFFSRSYWKLTEACKAVESLLYPLKCWYKLTIFIIIFSLFDGLWIDLDDASVHVTENVKLAPMPEKPYNRILSSLFQIFKPDIHAADLAFQLNGRMNLRQDSGVISFHKASFLGHHRLVNDEFMLRVLDSMSFHKFIEEHGPPFQSCDIFDEVYATIYDQLKRKIDPIINNSSIAVLEHIKELANQLSLNKNPLTQQTYIQKSPSLVVTNDSVSEFIDV